MATNSMTTATQTVVHPACALTDHELDRAVIIFMAACLPSARRAGRNPAYPYVPIILLRDGLHEHKQQITPHAFQTRREAVDFAGYVLDQLGPSIRHRLQDPRERALRELCGLPRELPKIALDNDAPSRGLIGWMRSLVMTLALVTATPTAGADGASSSDALIFVVFAHLLEECADGI
jgi:hypothetical protein